jgi:hypothetical protein
MFFAYFQLIFFVINGKIIKKNLVFIGLNQNKKSYKIEQKQKIARF